MNFKEHDIVRIKADITDIPLGSIGTIVYVYDNGEAVDIEFLKKDGTNTVETLLLGQLEKIQ
jgi:hypothetical protein